MIEKSKDEDYEDWEKAFDKQFGHLKGGEIRTEIDYSDEIIGRIEEHDSDHGSVFVLATGSQGMCKTAVLLSCVDRALLKFPKEKVFFNECFDTPLQCTKLGKNKYHLMVESDEIQFFDRSKGGKQIYPEVTIFSDYEDCYKKARLGVANVLFFKNRMNIIDFTGYLRKTCQWNHLMIDELAEIGMAFSSGDNWRKIEQFSLILKDIRKTWVNVYSTAQSLQDIDSRILTKVMCFIFLGGSIRGKRSRVTQRAIDSLRVDRINGNEGFIEMSGRFCKTRFNKIYKPDPDNMIDARVVEKTKEEENA